MLFGFSCRVGSFNLVEIGLGSVKDAWVTCYRVGQFDLVKFKSSSPSRPSSSWIWDDYRVSQLDLVAVAASS